MSHKPPKNSVERLENLIEGLMDIDERELPSLEETNAEAKAAGIDFDAWGERIRRRAQEQLKKQQAERIAGALAARDRELTHLEARPRPGGTREEKIARLRELMSRPGGEALTAHFKKLEEASDEVLDELLSSAEGMVSRAREKGD